MAEDNRTDFEMEDWETVPETTDMESDLSTTKRERKEDAGEIISQQEEHPAKVLSVDDSMEGKIYDEEGFMIIPNKPKEPEKPPEVHFMNWRPGSRPAEVSDGRRVIKGTSKSSFRIPLPPQPYVDSLQTDTSGDNNPENPPSVPVPDPQSSSEERMQE